MSEPAPHERLMRQMIEICPFRVGNRVTFNPGCFYASEWPGEYVIVSLTWEYGKGAGHGINVGIASDEDIVKRYGYTDGFKVDDFLPVPRA
ncbi:hypothetical protein [Bradyrhizobium elkanii]